MRDKYYSFGASSASHIEYLSSDIPLLPISIVHRAFAMLVKYPLVGIDPCVIAFLHDVRAHGVINGILVS